MRVIVIARLRTVADRRPTAPRACGKKGSHSCIKVIFAAAARRRTTHGANVANVSTPRAAAASADKNTKMKKEPSAGQLATRERQKKCGAERKEAKAANKLEKGTTWPKFWSACNKRLKSASK